MERRKQGSQPKHPFLVRLPRDLYIRLKHFAVDAGRSLSAIVSEAIEQYLSSGK
jgi:predicted DNA-binding protein